MKLPKGVLFDFDGVLVNSFATHFNAWQKAFLDLFEEEVTRFPEDCEGKSPMHIAAAFCKIGGDSSKAKDLYHLKEGYLNSSKHPPKLLPGVEAWEHFLIKNEIPYGIASNATRQFLHNSVSQLKLKFKTIYGFEDYEKPKPAPEAYITLAHALGFQQRDFSDLWVFEDSLTGATAAKTAGMQTFGILTQYNSEELLQVGCSNTFANLEEAQGYLLR